MLKAIALDFDGVILESVDIKTRAFRELFKNHPEHLECIVRFHLENGGLSRYEKFAIIYRDYLKRPLSKSESERLAGEFAQLVRREILTCPLVPGAQDFLEQQVARVSLFIISGTPEAELREIVAYRKLDRYFRGVYGSPRTKDALLRAILAENAWDASEVVVIGDSLMDWRAAVAVGAPFIGRAQKGNAHPFPDSVRWVVSDLGELQRGWATFVRF